MIGELRQRAPKRTVVRRRLASIDRIQGRREGVDAISPHTLIPQDASRTQTRPHPRLSPVYVCTVQ